MLVSLRTLGIQKVFRTVPKDYHLCSDPSTHACLVPYYLRLLGVGT